eukprot:2414361-Rhodomonas_salina.4
MLCRYSVAGTTIRYLTTAHLSTVQHVASFAQYCVGAQYSTQSQYRERTHYQIRYRVARSSIRDVTVQCFRIAPYATSVPDIA